MKNVEELKQALIKIVDEKKKIIEVFYYPKGVMTAKFLKGDKQVKKDLIVVVYLWSCLGITTHTADFHTIEDCLHYFRDNKTKTSLSDVVPTSSVSCQTFIAD